MNDEHVTQLLKSHGQRWRDAHPSAPNLYPDQAQSRRPLRLWVTAGAAAAVAACVISALALGGTFRSDPTNSIHTPPANANPRSVVIALEVISATLSNSVRVQLRDPKGMTVALKPDIVPAEASDPQNGVVDTPTHVPHTVFWTATGLGPGKYTVRVGTGFCNSPKGCLSPVEEHVYCNQQVSVGAATRVMARLVSADGKTLCNIRMYGTAAARSNLHPSRTATMIIQPESRASYSSLAQKDLRLISPSGREVELMPDATPGATGTFIEFWVASRLKAGTYTLRAGPMSAISPPHPNGQYGPGPRLQNCAQRIAVRPGGVVRVVAVPTRHHDCAVYAFD